MENYLIQRIVGRGAFGTAFLCKSQNERTMNKDVIIKQIPIEQMSTLDRQATLNEVRVLAMLRHPHIIQYYDSFLHESAMMIVMEYAAGGTLHDLIEEAKAKDEGYLQEEEEIAFLFAQIILPMHYIHSQNILHRDLKAQNIFLTKNKNFAKKDDKQAEKKLINLLPHVTTLQIGDFGISKILTSKSKASTVVGTPSYISPELCEGRPYDQKSDVWSLGCILYEMCALQRAFQAPSLPALVLKIMRGRIQPLPSHFSSLLKDLVAVMLEVDPYKRPTLSQVMAHPWLAPRLYRLTTTLGALPCSSTSRRRPSVTPLLGQSFLQSSRPPRKRSASPFSHTITNVIRGEWDENHKFCSELVHQSSEKMALVCTSSDVTLGLNEAGKVLMLPSKSTATSALNDGIVRPLEAFVGIVIKYVTTAAPNLIAMLTDRGILMTQGKGSDGCLGHGTLESIKKPKIVELLLGEEIIKVALNEKHILALTSTGDLYSWGRNLGGCLGLGSDVKDDVVVSSPQKVPLKAHYDVTFISAGPQCTAFITSKGLMLASGKNHGKRLMLRAESSSHFMLSKVPAPVAQVAFGQNHTVLLQTNGLILTLLPNGILKEVKLDLIFPPDDNIQSVSTIVTKTNDVGLCVSSKGRIYKWDITDIVQEDDHIKAEQLTFDPLHISQQIVNLSVAKEHFIVAFDKK